MSRGAVVHVMGWASQQYGSFERFLVALAEGCAREGLETHLVFPSTPPSAAFRADVAARLHEVPLARAPLDPAPLRGLAGVLRAARATHLHAHFGLDALHAQLVARRAGVGCRYATKHITPGASRLTFSRTRHRWLARQVRALFAVSSAVAGQLVDLGVPPEKVVLAYLGVDTERYRPDPQRRAAVRGELGLREKDLAFVCTSHLREGKGVEMLPRLASELGDPAVVLLAGGGPLRDGLAAEAAQRGLGPERFRMLGVREDIPELLAAADVYLFPTTGSEGLPLSFVEAMAARLPVVASSVSDIPVLAEGAARLVPPGDFGALLDACRALAADAAARDRLGESARRRVQERLSVKSAVQLHLEHYLA